MSPVQGLGQRQTLEAGPWKGVRTTNDPRDGGRDFLYDAVNFYMPAPETGLAGFYSRLGFTCANSSNAIYTNATPFRGQLVFAHSNLDGSVVNFIAFGGHLFRAENNGSFTDVTPVGVTIDPNPATRLSAISALGSPIFNDEINRPWIGSNLSSTPITGTYIDYDGAGVTWSARAPFLYQNAVFFPLKQVNNVGRQTDLSWSEPGLPATGYQQTNFDDNWTLETTSGAPIYAGAATNNAGYYFRQLSIGSFTGNVGPQLASTATEDSTAYNVGSITSASIQKFGDKFFFCDAMGRPWMFTPGAAPVPIWHQMRAIVDGRSTSFAATTQFLTCSAIEPTLNLYLVAIWSSAPSTQQSPTEMYAFDATTGTYYGRWIIGPGIAIDAMGVLYDQNFRPFLYVLGSRTAPPATSGYAWTFSATPSIPDILTTNDGQALTTNNSVIINGTSTLQTNSTTAPGANVFKDFDVKNFFALPTLYVQTRLMGYDPDVMWTPDQATISLLFQATGQQNLTFGQPVGTLNITLLGGILTAGSPAVGNTVGFAFYGDFRFTCGFTGLLARGVMMRIQPSDLVAQVSAQSVVLQAVPQKAGPLDI